MSDVAETLERAADLLEPSGAWTQGDYALDAAGRTVRPDSPEAICWCMLGAIRKVGNYENDAEATPALKVVRAALPRSPSLLHEWNDRRSRTKEQVISALRKAAKLAREKSDA